MFTTTSELGGVLIGNKDWQVLVPNGYGDCTTTVHILKFASFEECEDFIKDKDTGKFYYNYFTLVKGSFGIYGYDATKDYSKPRVELNGSYQIYYSEKNVYFMLY